jgi:hypothetical protein
MRNVSNESSQENQNTHFMFSKFFPKIVPFTTSKKVVDPDCIWQYSGALHAG